MNDHYFTKTLIKFWDDKSNAKIQVALLMIDIDYINRYKDFHGHIEGNHCIQQVGNCMKTVIENHGGILGRFEGEAFVGFLKHISQNVLEQIAEELRASVEAMPLLYCWKQHAYPITISIGGAYGLCEQFDSKDEMYVITEEELYKAKTNGRNRVSIFAT